MKRLFRDWVKYLRKAKDAEELEGRWLEFINAWGLAKRRSLDRILKQAVTPRGQEFVAEHPEGKFVAQIGPQRQLSVCGVPIEVNLGQNGAEIRLAWHYSKQRAEVIARAHGFDYDTATFREVWNWSFRWPHRALLAMEQAAFGGGLNND